MVFVAPSMGDNKKPAQATGYFVLRDWWARWDLNPGPKDYELFR